MQGWIVLLFYIFIYVVIVGISVIIVYNKPSNKTQNTRWSKGVYIASIASLIITILARTFYSFRYSYSSSLAIIINSIVGLLLISSCIVLIVFLYKTNTNKAKKTIIPVCIASASSLLYSASLIVLEKSYFYLFNVCTSLLFSIIYIIWMSRKNKTSLVSPILLVTVCLLSHGWYVLFPYVVISFSLTQIKRSEIIANVNPVSPVSAISKFCPSCGIQFTNDKRFCDQCGGELKEITATVAPNPLTAVNPQQNPLDAPSAGFAALGFFFPLIGLILYLVWKDNFPMRSRSTGKGALIGFITSVALSIILTVVYIIILKSSFPF